MYNVGYSLQFTTVVSMITLVTSRSTLFIEHLNIVRSWNRLNRLIVPNTYNVLTNKKTDGYCHDVVRQFISMSSSMCSKKSSLFFVHIDKAKYNEQQQTRSLNKRHNCKINLQMFKVLDIRIYWKYKIYKYKILKSNANCSHILTLHAQYLQNKSAQRAWIPAAATHFSHPTDLYRNRATESKCKLMMAESRECPQSPRSAHKSQECPQSPKSAQSLKSAHRAPRVPTKSQECPQKNGAHHLSFKQQNLTPMTPDLINMKN